MVSGHIIQCVNICSKKEAKLYFVLCIKPIHAYVVYVYQYPAFVRTVYMYSSSWASSQSYRRVMVRYTVKKS
jgi:hypothetical protein